MVFRILAPTAALALVFGVPAGAASARDQPMAVPATPLQPLFDCRAIAEAGARLACFDKQAALLSEASDHRELVITNREELRKARRGLFGFALPITQLFAGGAKDKSAIAAEEITELMTTVASAHHGRDGGWVVAFAEGGTWEQTDSRSLALSPRPGQKAVLKRALLGSYFAEIDGQPGIKMRRVQ